MGQQIVRLLVTNMAVSSVVVLTRRAVPAAGEAAAVAWAREHLGLTDNELAKKIIAVHVSEADWEHDDASMSALDVMARDFAVREQAWLQTLLQTPAPAALVQVMNGVDVVFTAMGSSRANSETQAAQAAGEAAAASAQRTARAVADQRAARAAALATDEPRAAVQTLLQLLEEEQLWRVNATSGTEAALAALHAERELAARLALRLEALTARLEAAAS